MKIMTPDISTENSIGTISIERIDDIPLLVGLQQKIGIADVIDSIIVRSALRKLPLSSVERKQRNFLVFFLFDI